MAGGEPGAERVDERVKQAQARFVAVWGQMANAWGISRTMAEIHALLFLAEEPLCTDDIMERLQISRGNASMSLRALMDWGIVARTHKRGDRKEYFVSEQDVWALFRAIVRERMKREIDPLLASLYEIRDMTPSGGKLAPAERKALDAHNRRIDDMLSFFKTVEGLSQRFISPPGPGLKLAASLLRTVTSAGKAGEPGRADLGKNAARRGRQSPDAGDVDPAAETDLDDTASKEPAA
ncbi:MAG: ArsR family transcriptional regulator [Planctomycetota bacterium]|nr:ArsR family transcriptional regulator [Planctomycetota bacterium]